MVPEQEGENRDRQEEQECSCGNNGPVRQARAHLGWDKGRCRLRLAVGHDQRKGIFVPRSNEAEHSGCRDTCHRFRKHDLEERLNASVAVNQIRLYILARNIVDETIKNTHR